MAEKEAKKKGNSSLQSLMKHLSFSAKQTKEEGFTIGVGENTLSTVLTLTVQKKHIKTD